MEYKKELKDLNTHLRNWLNRVPIDSWDVKTLRNEILRKIAFFEKKQHTDVFHPCIDRNILLKSLSREA